MCSKRSPTLFQNHNNRTIVLARLNGLLRLAVGGSDWTLCSAFCPLIQDHTYDVCVPAVSLPALLRFLLLQRVDVRAADPARLLGRAHPAHGCQIPAGQCEKRGLLSFFTPRHVM